MFIKSSCAKIYYFVFSNILCLPIIGLVIFPHESMRGLVLSNMQIKLCPRLPGYVHIVTLSVDIDLYDNRSH